MQARGQLSDSGGLPLSPPPLLSLSINYRVFDCLPTGRRAGARAARGLSQNGAASLALSSACCLTLLYLSLPLSVALVPVLPV